MKKLKSSTEDLLSNNTSIKIINGNVTMSNDVFLNLSLKGNKSYIDFDALNNATNMIDNSIPVYILSVQTCTRDLNLCSVPIYAQTRALSEEIALTSIVFFVKSLTSSNAFNTNLASMISDSTRFTGLDIIGRELPTEKTLQCFFFY